MFLSSRESHEFVSKIGRNLGVILKMLLGGGTCVWTTTILPKSPPSLAKFDPRVYSFMLGPSAASKIIYVRRLAVLKTVAIKGNSLNKSFGVTYLKFCSGWWSKTIAIKQNPNINNLCDFLDSHPNSRPQVLSQDYLPSDTKLLRE